MCLLKIVGKYVRRGAPKLVPVCNILAGAPSGTPFRFTRFGCLAASPEDTLLGDLWVLRICTLWGPGMPLGSVVVPLTRVCSSLLIPFSQVRVYLSCW